MQLLNEKLMLECNEQEELQHQEEIEKIALTLYKLPNINCALVITDSRHKEPRIEICKMHDIFEELEYFDITNGVDIYEDNDFLTFALNGQPYTKNGTTEIFLTFVKVLPLDANNNPIRVYVEKFI